MTQNNFLRTLIYTGIFVLGVVIFLLGGEAGYQTKYWLEQQKINRNMENFNKSLVKVFQEDTFGGKTPEETFNMFVSALKAENVDLAVKYFVLDTDRRANQQESLNKLKIEGKLKEYGEWFPKWADMSQENVKEDSLTVFFYWTQEKAETKMLPDGAGGFIETTFPAGKYRNSIDFLRNTNNIWKIENL